MDVQVTIIDTDEASRAQMKAALAREGIKADIAAKAGPGPNIWIGDREQEVPADIAADNQFTKPVRLGVVLDRVGRLQAGKAGKVKRLKIGAYELDTTSNELLVGDDRAVRVTDKEKLLLVLLSEARGKPVERQELLEKVWGYAPNLETHTLETHIYRLRQKIERDPAKPEILLTDGTGYKIS